VEAILSVRLIDSLAATGPLADVFSDASILAAMLQFEVALAHVEARLGVIPRAAADAIATAAAPADFDSAALAQQARQSATLSIPFVKALTALVRARDPQAAGFVHWGATSQDLADTALMLVLKRARLLMNEDLHRLQTVLQSLSGTHPNTVMLGRTLLQAAPPITFGLKAAGWLAAVRRSHIRLHASFEEALVLQFGGASGTLAALGTKGLAAGDALAAELDLHFPDAPWHAHRDRLAALLCSCGVLTGCLGKIARDISLLMQNEIAEVAEPSAEGRGGSSAMPHKHNPSGCAIALAAATRTPGLVASFLSGMVQEHERAVGGWQAEWPTVAGVIQATGSAAASMAEVAAGLKVDAQGMRKNIDATQGAAFSEKASLLLGQKLGRDAAHRLLEEAVRKSMAERRRLGEVLAEMPEVTQHLDAATLSKLESPEDYLGVCEDFRLRLLAQHASSPSNQEKD
jgi:3-carboxy-cis,cis-muconate cycloisomerase